MCALPHGFSTSGPSAAADTILVSIQNAISGEQLEEKQCSKVTAIGTVLHNYISRTMTIRVLVNNVLVDLSETVGGITDTEKVALRFLREPPLPYPRNQYLLRVYVTKERFRRAVHVTQYDMLFPKLYSRFRRVLPQLIRHVAGHGAIRFARRLASDFPPTVQRRRLLESVRRRCYVHAGDALYERLDVVDVVFVQNSMGHFVLHENWYGSKVERGNTSMTALLRWVVPPREST